MCPRWRRAAAPAAHAVRLNTSVPAAIASASRTRRPSTATRRRQRGWLGVSSASLLFPETVPNHGAGRRPDEHSRATPPPLRGRLGRRLRIALLAAQPPAHAEAVPPDRRHADDAAGHHGAP